MTDVMPQCQHRACTCTATDGDFCSDYCRAHAVEDEMTCLCNHVDCAGTSEASEGVA